VLHRRADELLADPDIERLFLGPVNAIRGLTPEAGWPQG
jgi:hypothetical protein